MAQRFYLGLKVFCCLTAPGGAIRLDAVLSGTEEIHNHQEVIEHIERCEDCHSASMALVFSTPDLVGNASELVFTAVNLPSDLLGAIVLSDGTLDHEWLPRLQTSQR